jgi:hypothetical protein
MAVPSYPLDLPSTPAIQKSNFGIRRAVGMSQSIFTGEQQVYAHSMALWEGTFSLPPMNRTDASLWQSFFLKLRGVKGTFLIGDPDAKTIQGAASGTIRVNGTHAIGVVDIAIDGLAASTSNVFKIGDYVQFGSSGTAKLHMVVANATSDSGGQATITVEPALKVALANDEAITFANTVGVFRLESNALSWSANQFSTYGIAFSCVEAL